MCCGKKRNTLKKIVSKSWNRFTYIEQDKKSIRLLINFKLNYSRLSRNRLAHIDGKCIVGRTELKRMDEVDKTLAVLEKIVIRWESSK